MVSTHMCTETRPTRALIKVSEIKLIESKLLDQNLLYFMFHRNLTQQIALKLFFSFTVATKSSAFASDIFQLQKMF